MTLRATRWNAWVAELADRLDERGLSALRTGPESLGAEHLAGATGLAAAARAILSQRDGEVLASLERITAPTVIVVGAEDERFLPAAQVMARRIAGAREVTLANAGHAANIEQAAAFNLAVCDFLEEL